MSGSSIYESYEENWNQRESTLEDEKVAEQDKFKDSLSSLAKQSLDRTSESRNLGAIQQQVSGSRIPVVKPVSAARWFQPTTQENPAQPVVPQEALAAAPVHYTKNHKLAVEPKGKMAAFMDMLTAPFRKGETK